MTTSTTANEPTYYGVPLSSLPHWDVQIAILDGYISPKLKVAIDSYNRKNMKEITNDTPEDIAKGAIKYDGAKSPVFRGAIDYFPRAISAVAEVSAFGASKYAWKGWEGVPDGYNRYSDALVRHLIYEGEGEVLDIDSGLLHAAHAAWNALARLELELRAVEEDLA